MMTEIDTADLKAHAPLIPYVQTHYKDKFIPEKYTKDSMFCKCPWHQENTGSLVFFSNGTFKCFGCGIHGDIITLVQLLEKVSFEEACKIIGDNVGYPISLTPINPAWEAYKDRLDNHTRRYWSILQQTPEALNYLINIRGISPQMIDRFRLGFTPADEYKYRSDIGSISSKLVFPILEHKRRNPKCVGMAYRSLTDEKPKYINDSNQDGRDGQDLALSGVFIKGDMLYGLYQAYDGIKQFEYAILTEGYFDVIALHQSGLTNAVCSMGTCLTDAQISSLARLTKNVLIIYDGDKAGVEGSLRAIKALFEANFNVAVCILDDGKDPADLCKELKFNYMKVNMEIKTHTTQAISFVVNKITSNYRNIVTRERVKALQSGVEFLNTIKDQATQKVFENELYQLLDLRL